MNIFVTNKNPHLAARDLDDRRLVKMVLETAQIICTAAVKKHPYDKNPSSVPYKPTHINHPCCLWANEKTSHLIWLVDYFVELSDEYTFRFNKVHKSYTTMQVIGPIKYVSNTKPVHRLFLGENIVFVNCAANATKGLNFKHIEDTVLAYRLYLIARWELELQSGYQPKFTKRDFPEWYKREVEGVDYVSV